MNEITYLWHPQDVSLASPFKREPAARSVVSREPPGTAPSGPTAGFTLALPRQLPANASVVGTLQPGHCCTVRASCSRQSFPRGSLSAWRRLFHFLPLTMSVWFEALPSFFTDICLSLLLLSGHPLPGGSEQTEYEKCLAGWSLFL